MDRYHTFVEEGPWEGKLTAELVEENDPHRSCRLNGDVAVHGLELSVECPEGDAAYRWSDRDEDTGLVGLEETFSYEGETFDLDAFIAPRAWQCGVRSYVSTRSPHETVHTYTTSRRDHTALDADLTLTEEGYRFEGTMQRTATALGNVQTIIEAETGIDIFEELPYNAGDW